METGRGREEATRTEQGMKLQASAMTLAEEPKMAFAIQLFLLTPPPERTALPKNPYFIAQIGWWCVVLETLREIQGTAKRICSGPPINSSQKA